MFMSPVYLPRQRKVLPPFSTIRPEVSMLRPSSIARWAAGKSSPTTPTRRTGVKKLAAYEKNEAEPPRASVDRPVRGLHRIEGDRADDQQRHQ